ncbi:MAG: 7-cyano-7-deazaguanine synthase QueC [Proteobacteria bacterium]|nr:7-cyano-7-deazaguanine synthase QueC [Pseudomonadota bacterium]
MTKQTKNNVRKAVVLLSGGMDSTTVLAQAISMGFEVHTLTFDYGQRPKTELQAAQNQANAFAVASHRTLALNLASFGGSALTGTVPIAETPCPAPAPNVPATYVPARNAVFLSLALSLAEAIGARDIFIGVSSVDYSGYPDCRPAFVHAFEEMANQATCAAPTGERFRIHAPLQHLSKAATIQLGLSLGVDFQQTHTCYEPDGAGKPCGVCDACVLRQKGFAAAGMTDPLLGD